MVALHNQTWNNSPGIIDLMASSTDCFLLFDDDDNVIGYAFIEEDPERGFIELQDIAVSPDYRQKGGGKTIMKAIMEKYPFIKLIARIKNKPLIEFYRSLDFQEEGKIENYYEIGQDGLRMFWRSPGH